MDIPFPALSTDNPDTEGVLATGYVREGEHVSEGQLLADVQVDKVDAEVHAPAAGTIHLLTPEGEAVVQGSPIARIE